MKIVGDKIILSKKEVKIWKQIYEETKRMKEEIPTFDFRVKRYYELIK